MVEIGSAGITRQFVKVPVPAEYVTKVMGHIAELDGAFADVAPVPEEAAMAAVAQQEDEVASREWSIEELRDLATGRNFTTKLLTRVMDALAREPDAWRSSAELAELIGEERSTLKGIWTHVGRHIGKRYAGLPWPLQAKWGPDISPSYDAVGFYRLTRDQAARWADARGDDLA